MKHFYLPLAVLGLLVPYFFLGLFLVRYGLDLALIYNSLFGNPIATFFVADLLISIVVFWIFLGRESRRLGMKSWGFYISATVLVGLSFSFPLFMHFRERRRTYLREKHSHHED